jgi:hypothetical protein
MKRVAAALTLSCALVVVAACSVGPGASNPIPATPVPLPTGVVLAGVLLPTSLPSTPPEPAYVPAYAMEVVAHQDGVDGFVVYFTLADKTELPAAADGIVYMTVQTGEPAPPRHYETTMRTIKKRDFDKVKVGTGASARELLAYRFKRITYEMMGMEAEPRPGTPMRIAVYF